VRDRK
jgi:hypothetical protein